MKRLAPQPVAAGGAVPPPPTHDEGAPPPPPFPPPPPVPLLLPSVRLQLPPAPLLQPPAPRPSNLLSPEQYQFRPSSSWVTQGSVLFLSRRLRVATTQDPSQSAAGMTPRCEVIHSLDGDRGAQLRSNVLGHHVVVSTRLRDNDEKVIVATLTSRVSEDWRLDSYVAISPSAAYPGMVSLGPGAMLNVPSGRYGGYVYLYELYVVPWLDLVESYAGCRWTMTTSAVETVMLKAMELHQGFKPRFSL